MYDFTFSNSSIKNWFESKDGSTPPTKEFQYLHSHPLVKPNFLVQLEVMILEASRDIQVKNIVGKPISELSNGAVNMAEALNDFMATRDDDSAQRCLLAMRRVYKACKFVSKIK